MKKSRFLILSIIGIIVISLGILNCNKLGKKAGEDLTKYDYVASFYSIHQNGKMNPQTKIVFASSDKEQLEFSDKVYTAGRLFQEGNTVLAYSFSGNKSLLQHSQWPRVYLNQPYIQWNLPSMGQMEELK